MTHYPTIRDAQLDGKRVLLRAGFDVPLEKGIVTDTSRIEAVLPTITYILQHGGSVILLAHQDRPKGKIVPEMSQKPLVPVLEHLLGRSVGFAPSCTGVETKRMVDDLAPGGVLLLENLRFDSREEANDRAFASELVALGDLYVNDAFANCHRTHASVVALPHQLPSYMGLHLEQEVTHLSSATDSPKHPITLIVSGAKTETKLPVIERFLALGDYILPGGAIANTLAASLGLQLGHSLVDPDFLTKAAALSVQSQSGTARILPLVDGIVAEEPDGQTSAVDIHAVPPDAAVYDIGPATIDTYTQALRASQTIVWNGPLGMYENPQFAAGSLALAAVVRERALEGATVIIGGGDTIDFHTRFSQDMTAYTWVSTGGGAMLDFIAGKTLPALEALLTAQH